MAFYVLLALFPAIIAGVSIYGLVADPQTVRDQINRLAQTLSPETAKLIGQQVQQVTSSAGGALGLATVIGILTALWSASSGMKALITGVNLAYDETEGRKFVKLRGLSILMTLGAMVLLGVALALIVGFPAVPDSWPTVLQWTAAILRFVLLAVLLMAGLAALYRYAPDRDKPKWSWASPGSMAATVLWVLASVGFSVYVNAFGNYNKTYGALAGIIILMFWLYLTAFVVLVGAELNAEMELQTAKDTTAGPTSRWGSATPTPPTTSPKHKHPHSLRRTPRPCPAAPAAPSVLRPHAASMVGASFSHHAQGGGIWPDGRWHACDDCHAELSPRLDGDSRNAEGQGRSQSVKGVAVDIIGVIIAGIIIGLLGKFFAPGDRDNIPLWLTIVCGVGGVLIGYYLAAALGVEATRGIDWIRWIISIVVAAILVMIAASVTGQTRQGSLKSPGTARTKSSARMRAPAGWRVRRRRVAGWRPGRCWAGRRRRGG